MGTESLSPPVFPPELMAKLIAERRNLIEACGVIEVCRASLASNLEFHQEHVIDALRAASTMVNRSVTVLEEVEDLSAKSAK